MIHFLLFIIYVSFISLGLPDGLLGSAWPSMYPEFEVPVSFMGIVSMTISAGTIISSLQSDKLTKKFGTGPVTAVSVAMTAGALLGFSLSDSFPMLVLFAVPYGLGAGGVDAALNNYVALHYESRHMSWLHCMWGVGAIAGPYAMGFALTGGLGWQGGYRIIFTFQLILSAILFATLHIWKKNKNTTAAASDIAPPKAMPLRDVLKIPGVVHVLLLFLCYCALEAVCMLWASSYMVLHNGISPEKAASFASLFFIGLTGGRALNGFLSYKLSDTDLIRIGCSLIGIGVAVMLLPLGEGVTLAGLIITGLGCAPIYPCIIHSTPALFGEERSQAIIGVQMASAYTGACLMPPLYGLLSQYISPALFPYFIGIFLLLMLIMHPLLIKITSDLS